MEAFVSTLRKQLPEIIVMLGLFLGVMCYGEVPDGAVSTGPWKLTWDKATGNWLDLTWKNRVIASNPSGSLAFEFQSPQSSWIISKSQFKTADWNAEKKCLSLVRTVGFWVFTEEIVFGAEGNSDRLSRTVHCLNTSEEPVKFYDLGMRVAIPPKGEYFLPAQPFKENRRGSLSDLKQRERISTGWGSWPILVSPASDLTVLYVVDGRHDPIDGSIRRENEAVIVENHIIAKGWAEPGQSQSVGPAYLEVIPMALDQAFESAVWKWYDDIGLKVPKDRPDWVGDSVLYAMHPGGTIGSNFQDLGGFKAATQELLPRIANLGIGAIWLLPLEDRSCYWPRDYYKLMPGIGSEADYKEFVKSAHKLGLKVWQDNVPHGGSPEYGQLRGNKPWWLVFDEKGDALHYWCFDFQEPGWQKYIAGVTDYYMREIGIDGFRIDAVGGSHAMNWRRKGFPAIDRVPANVPKDWWQDELKKAGGVPALPYERASLTVREGGLQMIKTIRDQVKKNNPRDGAVLAEVQNAPYMQEGDVVYDFAYGHLLLSIRHRTPDEFARGLQEWLHEQKYSEPRGTMRLRYVESHDTMRGAGFYGIAANRALAALSCWIDGMPMIYHDSDIGNEESFKKILTVRNELVELRRGEAHYNWIQADPAPVFTCVRVHKTDVSVVAVNLSGETCSAVIPIPWARLKISGPQCVWNAMTGRVIASGNAAELTSVKLTLEPWDHTVLALRPESASAPISWPKPKSAMLLRNAGQQPKLTVGAQAVNYVCPDYRIEINRATGMPTSFTDGTGKALIKSVAWIYAGDSIVSDRLSKGVFSQGKLLEWSYGGGTSIAYDFAADHVAIRLTAGPEFSTQRLGLLLRPANVARCEIASAEGVLQDSFPVRHTKGTAASGSIYYRTQGSPAVWQSRLTPMLPDTGVVRFFDRAGRGVAFELGTIESPNVNLAVFDRAAGVDGLHFAAMLRDPGRFVQDSSKTDTLTLFLRPIGADSVDLPARSEKVKLHHNSVAWVVENEYYRLNLSRNGGLMSRLCIRKPGERVVLSHGDIYTDKGFPVEGSAPSVGSDVETAVAAWREGDVLRMRFEGMIRGEHRFGQPHPPLWFSVEYAFDGSQSFRTRWSVMSEGQVQGNQAFLSWKAITPDLDRIEMLQGGKTLCVGTSTNVRTAETRKMNGAPVPDEIRVSSGGQTTLQFTDLACHAPGPMHNIFNLGSTVYMAWLDPPDKTIEPGAWYEASMTVTPGAAVPGNGNPIPWVGESMSNLFLDSSFESVGADQVLTVPEGKSVTLPGDKKTVAWSAPDCGRIVSPGHDGNRCAMIDNQGGEYALFTQPLNSGSFPPGCTIRIQAWVKGEDIKNGDVNWKTGILGLQCQMADGKMAYPSSADFSGTFDWKLIKGDIQIPANSKAASLRVGLNGATGKVWIDAVDIKRLK